MRDNDSKKLELIYEELGRDIYGVRPDPKPESVLAQDPNTLGSQNQSITSLKDILDLYDSLGTDEELNKKLLDMYRDGNISQDLFVEYLAVTQTDVVNNLVDVIQSPSDNNEDPYGPKYTAYLNTVRERFPFESL